ncbi:hypothetical protein QM012_006890 [Aureobasidium pullulans]|uniref:BHLH domain-containing protein n=1 Tax=Aureobasidium pullulans TaxID=5580 RepID=A0ABR0TPX0_AURPU
MPPTEDKRKAARETIDILYEISSLLTVIKDLRDRNGVATEPREKQ